MSLINKVYTAQDMRDAAKCLFACEVDLKHDNRDISRMLRQSADMMDRAADREAAHQREVAELRECLKEAIREKCPFTRMSCKHGEPCDYECETFKWRKALKGASND